VKIIADTNVLVRCAVRDDLKQTQVAEKTLKEASFIAVSLSCLCEFVWVLKRFYSFDSKDIAMAVRALLNTQKMAMNRPAVEAGLDLLESGGDFADGVIAYEGKWLGGETFVSFDKRAVQLLVRRGQAAKRLD